MTKLRAVVKKYITFRLYYLNKQVKIYMRILNVKYKKNCRHKAHTL